MQNKLKEATTQAIETLHSANIRTIMATGDNILTAISVGRECSIVGNDTEVFLGDVKNFHGVDRIYWKSTSNTSHRLNPGTLLPNDEFLKDDKEKPRNTLHSRKNRSEIDNHDDEDGDAIFD